MRETRVRSLCWEDPLEKEMKWQSTPVLVPGKSHGQRSLVGYSLWGHKESDTTERFHFQGPTRAGSVLLSRMYIHDADRGWNSLLTSQLPSQIFLCIHMAILLGSLSHPQIQESGVSQ